MAQLAGDEVTRSFIHQLENGASRPSASVLKMIGRRTGKSTTYFTAGVANGRLKTQALATELLSMAVRVRRLAQNTNLSPTQRQAIKLLEASLRQGAVLARML